MLIAFSKITRGLILSTSGKEIMFLLKSLFTNTSQTNVEVEEVLNMIDVTDIVRPYR